MDKSSFQETEKKEMNDICFWCHQLLNTESPDVVVQQTTGDSTKYYFHKDCYQEYIRMMRDRI